MKKIVLLATLILTLGAGFALAEDAAALYKSRCAGCHGADGSKPASNESKAIKGMSAADSLAAFDKYLKAEQPKGQVLVMQGVLKKLSPEQLQLMADYTSKL